MNTETGELMDAEEAKKVAGEWAEVDTREAEDLRSMYLEKRLEHLRRKQLKAEARQQARNALKQRR